MYLSQSLLLLRNRLNFSAIAKFWIVPNLTERDDKLFWYVYNYLKQAENTRKKKMKQLMEKTSLERIGTWFLLDQKV